MGFQLVGEVIIDGRKGTIALKDLQREATRTSAVFNHAGGSTEKLGKSLLHLGLNAGSAHASLRSLERLGATGLFAGAIAAGITKFGEATKKSAEDYYQTRKSLNNAFEESFKSTSVEQAQEGISKTQEAIESLQGKIAQLGASKKILASIEKFTGINLGVADTEQSLKDAQAQLEVQKQIVEMRKEEKEQIDTIEKTTRKEELQRKTTAETLKLIDSIRKTKKNTLPLLEMEVEGAISARNENERIIEVLKSNNGELRNKEEIQKRIINGQQLELNIIKAQNALTPARISEQGQTLKGSKAGQIALQGAEKEKARREKDQAFREEEDAVKKRQYEENKKRGGPPLSRDSIRRMMAEEAVGMPTKTLPRPPRWKAESEMDQTGNIPNEKGASSVGSQIKALADATKALAAKIPAAVPV